MTRPVARSFIAKYTSKRGKDNVLVLKGGVCCTAMLDKCTDSTSFGPCGHQSAKIMALRLRNTFGIDVGNQTSVFLAHIIIL